MSTASVPSGSAPGQPGAAPARPRRIHVLLLTDAQSVEPGSCPACRWPLVDFGCHVEAAWIVRPRARRRTGIRAVYTAECRGPLDSAALIPCPMCPRPAP
jgi:hypothetical protein